MTESMIERVARALHKADGTTSKRGIWIGNPDDYWKAYETDARDAIEAMREPTPAMIEAGLKALAEAGCGSPIYGWASENCLRAMIDAALIWPAGSADKAGVPLAEE